MDDISRYNKARWEALAQARVAYSRPFLDLNPDTARQAVDSHGIMGDVTGSDVLCLAAGGGQQSVAFALLGANVTVLEISETQLDRDREALAHHGLSARLEQGDMRDLSRFADHSFDVVWHAFSISFIPDTRPVFDEVARVLRPGGLYHLAWHNPFVQGLDDRDFVDGGYVLRLPYADGEVLLSGSDWDIQAEDGTTQRIEGPREFRHTLSTVLNGLIRRGFVLRGLWEDMLGDPDKPTAPGEAPTPPAPGSWDHYLSVAPMALILWARYLPDLR
jgi:SAM-dependent methyltransferase